MTTRRIILLAGTLVCACAVARAARADTACTMQFNLTGWSAFYKTASGSGTVTCDNGQTASVGIHATGGGLTVGKSKISDGHGRFSQVSDISDIFGSYGVAEAHAGMGTSSSAQVMTKGIVSLELTGKGQGVDLGVAFGKFTISKRR
jgi:hypothetical protein